ncbi:MAG: rhomboid family intramembrane serine protease [Acidimicrobiia bacterium]
MLPLGDRNPTSRFAVVTLLLIVVNVAIYFLFQPTPGNPNSLERAQFTYRTAAIPEEITSREPLTAIEVAQSLGARNAVAVCNTTTAQQECFPHKRVWLSVLASMFLHGNVMHVLGNMWFLWIFGNNVEDRLGRAAFVLFYLAAGVFATLAFVALAPSGTDPLVGASGAIAGVMGAYLVWWPRVRVYVLVGFIPLPFAAWLWLGIWFVLQFFTDPNSGVAWIAHVGGFLFGMVVAFLLRREPKRLRPAPTSY